MNYYHNNKDYNKGINKVIMYIFIFIQEREGLMTKYNKLLILVLVLIIVSSIRTEREPVISFNETLRPVTEEEFEKINSEEIINPQIDNFKYYELRVKGDKLKNLVSSGVSIPEFKDITKALKEYNSNIWALGNTRTQNNGGEDFFVYEYDILLNMSEITLEELKDILNEFEVKVHIQTRKGLEINEKYNLGEELELI